ncbi:hypothetical protein LSTR_LSTR014564 [Laodelphax striatellus]|uniref:Ubiquitin carboxyl-terminal hydrolase 47 C-terminal domain-containing protein n=1 Tax=Laodelphax striatellus TaxID=195883 RepID=A0A482WN48_LAOST|nr:hypothetical protein LSTR_LSTR014564 [Laodelphax striatellus]
MLMYRQIDKDRNCDAITVENFPPHIKELYRQMQEKEENDRKMKEKESEVCRLKIHCRHPESKKDTRILVRHDRPLEEVTELAWKQMELENVVPLEQCRLVTYDPIQEVIEESYEGHETDTISSILAQRKHINRPDFLLEVRQENATFEHYQLGGLYQYTISEVSGIPVEFVEFTKSTAGFPSDVSVLSVQDMEWNRQADTIDGWPLSIDDGNVLFYRDNREQVKTLTNEERKELTNKENARLGSTCHFSSPRKERPLKIYFDGSRSNHTNSSTSSNADCSSGSNRHQDGKPRFGSEKNSRFNSDKNASPNKSKKKDSTNDVKVKEEDKMNGDADEDKKAKRKEEDEDGDGKKKDDSKDDKGGDSEGTWKRRKRGSGANGKANGEEEEEEEEEDVKAGGGEGDTAEQEEEEEEKKVKEEIKMEVEDKTDKYDPDKADDEEEEEEEVPKTPRTPRNKAVRGGARGGKARRGGGAK